MLLEKILECWEVNDPLPEKADAIVLISYGITNRRTLTEGSRLVTEKALKLLWKYPSARVYFGEFSKNLFKGIEREIKISWIPIGTYVGEVSSTTDECEAVLKKIAPGQTVVVVSEGAHSRRARIVWHHLAKDRKIYFTSVSAMDAADPTNPMQMQRSAWKWFLVNFLLTPFYKYFPGVGWFAKRNFSQPT